MELRTAYCLNALFQRNNPARLLNTAYSRVNTVMEIDGKNTRVVNTPGEAALYLTRIRDNWPAASHFGYDSQSGSAVIEFVIKGVIYDRPCFDRPCEYAVDALNLKFFDPEGPSVLQLDETFLQGLVHYDSLPELRAPNLPGFIEVLRQAGETWSAIDFLHGLPCKAKRLVTA
jgi:hypothetical protein